MEATTIDQLVPDVLEEIFSYLSGSNLKNGSSAVTMKKFKIGFRLDMIEFLMDVG